MPDENHAIPVEVHQRPVAGRPDSVTDGQHAKPQVRTRTEERVTLTPPIDIHEGPEGLILEADLPGVTESGLKVELEDNVLSLHGRSQGTTPEGGRLVHEEYPVSDYYRSFILSDEVERARITAELKHGVLRLTLPRAERSKARRIEVKS